MDRRNKLLERGFDQPKKNTITSKAVQNSLLTAEAVATASTLESLNNIANFSSYYKAIPGGTYQETLKYVDKPMPDNRNGIRLNLSQQRLHTEMINMQYVNKN